MVDKNYCMSSYLALRYIEKDNVDFKEGLRHRNFVPLADSQRIKVRTAEEIGRGIASYLDGFRDKKMGILLSGGMDSAICASYMPGCDAYTFRFLGGEFQKEELARAEYYANYYGLKLHYVDIDWNTVEQYLEPVMRGKCAPVHSIEPQLLRAALQAKEDGVELLVVGESSDLVFGGMDQLLSQDWEFNAFMNRYIFTQPSDVLRESADISYLFERYRKGNKIDFLRFMDEVFSVESSGSYMNAFEVAQMPYIDPYSRLMMDEPLDLHRIRNGEPKYLIRELMAMRYPDIPVPNKVPMPRPVDIYFADWRGPNRAEFKANLDMKKFTGNQKWQMYCLEKFLNIYDPVD